MRMRGSSDDVLRQLGCTLTPCGIELTKGLSLEDWAALGQELGKQQNALQWWIGDWWNLPSHAYGERSALVEAEDWTGPTYSTCANAGTVCKTFELSRRRESLPFKHHAEVASLPPHKADALLDWCEETIATTGKPRSIRALREKMNRLPPGVALRPLESAPAKALIVTVEPALPKEEVRAAVLLIPAIPRYEPEVQEQLGELTPDDGAVQKAKELAFAGLNSALRVEGIPADLRERLQECLRILR
jgi:hypothetical protein